MPEDLCSLFLLIGLGFSELLVAGIAYSVQLELVQAASLALVLRAALPLPAAPRAGSTAALAVAGAVELGPMTLRGDAFRSSTPHGPNEPLLR